MNGVPFSEEEKNFIWAYRNDLTYIELASKVLAIFGTKRSPQTISTLTWRREFREETVQSKPEDGPGLLGTRNFKPEITNRRLVWAMTKTDTTLFDIAAIIGIDIDHVRGLVAMGGIPKLYAAAVRLMYKKLGERV